MSSPVRPGDRRASIMQSPAANATSVKVVVRIRPTTSADATSVPQRFQRVVVQPISETALQADNPSPSASGAGKHAKQLFTFDRVVGPEEGQSSVYESATSLVDAYLTGYNATILAYGQTSSGKSYTMGTDRMQDEVLDDPSRQGITPRAVAEIFDRLKSSQEDAHGALSFTAKVSYVEIYNEDLIDLLAGDVGVRPTVQIREDKQGRIFWSGLREVKVSSAADVMNLLAAGSALRQTGATDMNAQSSRSHAIFSLTVTQQRWTGSGPAPSSPAPVTPASPTHNRRASALPRMASPAPSTRPGTPSSERPASRFGLRPPSTGGRPSTPQGDEAGTWTNVTSKFHFVDLAGSERLKRTAAAGERAKEGISINAGLSALGNVISALGDPTKKATHIPYRDSKLTRLLQDSLGGNARTMMIACISPAEFNLHETLSTLKYANRARNIKNRAEVNETEAGWDDLLYLQRTIVKLRAELATIKSGDIDNPSNDGDTHAGDVFDATLQQRVALLTAELAKAQEAAPSRGDLPASSLSRDQFAAAVEPIVEEYERSLSALESQLALTRAALGHSEEEMRDLESRVDEEVKANQANEALIEDLRIRVAKLTERESTTEAYVRDIESKLKEVDEAGEANGSAMSDLRKELARSREQTLSTEVYIKELEARLAQADTTTTSLRRQIETLERDVVQREEAHRELEARVALLDNSSETKLLIAEIDEKDRRLSDLERSLDEVKASAHTARAEIARLQQVADLEKAEKEDLLGRVRTLEHNGPRPELNTPTRRPLGEAEAEKDEEQDQLAQLQAAHDNTVRELEQAQKKYREALKEIEDLHGQAQEARLLRSPPSLSSLSERTSSTDVSSRRRAEGDEIMDDEVEELSESPIELRATPRTPTARRSVPLAPQHGLSFLGRGQGASSPSQLRCASLQQELSSAVSSQTSCPPSPRAMSPSASSHARRESLFGPTERSYDQLKEEIRKLQDALHERDDEISTLESALQQQLNTPATTPSLGDSPIISFSPLVTRPATPPGPTSASDAGLLSPRTVATFDSLRTDFTSGDGLGFVSSAPTSKSSPSDSHARLDELMMSMAAKERAHRESVENLDDEILSLRRANDELSAFSRDQAENFSEEIESLRDELATRPVVETVQAEVEQLQAKLAVSEAALAEHETQRQSQEDMSRAALASLEASKKAELDDLRSRHDEQVDCLRQELAASREESEAAQSRLLAQHHTEFEEASALAEQSKAATVQEALAHVAQEHSAAIAALEAQLQSAQLAQVDKSASELADHAVKAEATRAAYEAALTKLKAEHAERLRLEADDKVQLERRIEQVEADLCDKIASLNADQDSHENEIAALKAKHQVETAALLDEHQKVLVAKQTESDAARAEVVADLRATHDAALANALSLHAREKEVWALDTEQQLETLRSEHQASMAEAATTSQQTHAAELEDQRKVVEALRTTVSTLEAQIAAAVSTHQASLDSLAAEHADAIALLKLEFGQAVEEHATAHRREMQELAARHEDSIRTLQAERVESGAALATLIQELEDHKKLLSASKEAAAVAAREHEQHSAAAEEDAKALDARNQQLVADLHDLRREMGAKIQRLQSAATAELDAAEQRHTEALTSAQEEHERALETAQKQLIDAHDLVTAELRQELDTLAIQHRSDMEASNKEHAKQVELLRIEHEQALLAAQAQSESARQAAIERYEALQTTHATLVNDLARVQQELDGLRQSLASTAGERDALADRLDHVASQHASSIEAHAKEVTSLRQKLKLRESVSTRSSGSSDWQKALQALDALEGAFTSQREECARLRQQAQPADSNDGSGSAPTPEEEAPPDFTAYRDLVNKLDLSLAVAVKEKEALAQQLARMSLSSASAFAAPTASQPPSRPMSPVNEREESPVPQGPIKAEHFLSNASRLSMRLPPPAPPPTVPPPPVPVDEVAGSRSAKSSWMSDAFTADSPSAESAKEAEAALARLQQQLAQREADLQAQRDLANTLESALNDSERNLRKARQTSNEYARERDQYRETADRLKREAEESQSASESYRQSMIDMEERLQEQRTREARAERARLELEARMSEVNKRKSKFACF
ncbi:hypothetical protein JCM10908_004320 [Rhodotorula pacifica]|uniref:uncharacterized protein n=1 Tax=Rhodotorula pacifica TaxID=1495444 RepID=UPI00317F45BD